MSKYIVLDKRKNIKKIKKIFDNLNLQKSFKNNRTEIWENDEVQVSIDKSIIRVLIYSIEDLKYYTEVFTRG